MSETTWAGHDKGSREYRRILVALLCAGVATFAQLYSPQGILPEISTELGVTADQSALLISAATIGLAASVLPWSIVADRIGRLPSMMISLISATILGVAVALCPSFGGILAFRVLEGIALGGLPALAITYLQEEINPRYTAIAAGTYVSGTTLGGLSGRIVAAPFAEWFGWRWGVGAVVLLAALAAAGFILLAPKSRGFDAASARNRPPVMRTVWASLRSPAMLTLYAQGFLLMGSFVTVYNYLAFRLQRPPFGMPTSLIALLFLAYLAGTWSSRQAGSLATRFGRLPVLVASTAVMITGGLVTLIPNLMMVIAGLVVFTTGFFGAHSIASGWVGARAVVGRAQATSLYNLFYYAGSSVVGWFGGVIFLHFGWGATVAVIIALTVIAGACAIATLRENRRPRAAAAQTPAVRS